MTALDAILILAALVTGGLLGWWLRKPSTANPDMALMQEKTVLATKLEAALTEKRDLVEKLDHIQQKLKETSDQALLLKAREESFAQRLREQPEQVKSMAGALFEELSSKFTVQSEQKIGDLLTPFRERLSDFHKLVADSFTAQGKEQHTLKAEIEKIVLQTDGLTKALRGDVKAQGNWGEVMLERILEESALRRDIDYILQGAQMGLSDGDGTRQKPDVIVMLPESKHIIIDAKVSLTAYERYCSEPDELTRAIQLKDFIKSVKSHVNGLESKRYQDNEKLGTPDFVLMFMPVEGAYSLAVQADRELHSYAWGKRIVIVCPATLFATLRTIASLWRIEAQNKNAQKIAEESGKMYDKFVGFVADMEDIDKHMGRLRGSYDDALNKLSKGTGNLVTRAENLKHLGAKTSKALPREMIAQETVAHDEKLFKADA